MNFKIKTGTIIILIALSYYTSFAQKKLVFNSKNLPQTDTAWIFTPKNLDKKSKVSAVVLLHDWSGKL